MVKIGKIVATHGVKGDLIVIHNLGCKADFSNVKALFIEEQKDVLIPHFLDKGKARTIDESLLKLEEIDSKESAGRFVKKNIWLQASDFEKMVDHTAPISLLGFEIVDDGKSIGVVEEVIEQPHQVLLKTTIQHKEVLIPLHAETLDSVDATHKKVHLFVPDGLIDIYLNL